MRQSAKYILPALAAIFFAALVSHLSGAEGTKPLPMRRAESVFTGGFDLNRFFFERNTFGRNGLICIVLMIATESGTGVAAVSGSKSPSCSFFELPYAADKVSLLPQGLSPAPEPPADRTVRYVYALRKIIV